MFQDQPHDEFVEADDPVQYKPALLHLVGLSRYSSGRNADEPGRERRREGQRQQQRAQQRHHHGQRQGAEKDADDAIEKRQRDKHHNRRQRGAEQGGKNLGDSRRDRLESAHAGGNLGVDRLHHHDRVVNDQADGRGNAAECHQVEIHAAEFHHENCQQNGDGNHHSRYQRRSPTPQEQVENGDGKKQTEDDGLPSAKHRVANKQGLVVKERQFNIRRHVFADRGKPFLQLPGNVIGTRIRLGIDVKQHRINAVGSNHAEGGFSAPQNPGKILEVHGMALAGGDGEVLEVLHGMDPAVHDCQVHLVVLLVQPAGGNQIVPVEGFGHLGQGQAESRETQRIHDHLILGRLSADQFHARHTGNAEKFWLQVVTREFPQRRNVPPGRGEADADDGKCREVHPINFSLRGGGKGMPDLSEAAEDVKLRLPHVHLPGKEEIYLGRATTSC